MDTGNKNYDRIISWGLGLGFSVTFLAGLLAVVSPFIEGIVWAIVLVLLSWPVYRWLLRKFRMPAPLAALIMTAGTAMVLLLAVLPILMELADEALKLSAEKKFSLQKIEESLAAVPLIHQLTASAQLEDLIGSSITRSGEAAVKMVGSAAQTFLSSIFNFFVTIFAAYFLFLHGPKIAGQFKALLTRLGAQACLRFMDLIEDTVKGVVYGAFVTAIAQGTLAGLGFYFSNAPIPALLGLLTLIMSFVPFGTPFIYVPTAVYLMISGQAMHGLGLLLWGVCVVSTIDNILRPVFISHSVRMPVFIIFVGLVGGMLQFGLVGLFIGPVLIAIARAAWQLIMIDKAAQRTA